MPHIIPHVEFSNTNWTKVRFWKISIANGIELVRIRLYKTCELSKETLDYF